MSIYSYMTRLCQSCNSISAGIGMDWDPAQGVLGWCSVILGENNIHHNLDQDKGEEYVMKNVHPV